MEFNGKKIVGFQDFLVAVAETAPGHTVKVKVVRKGQEKVFDVTLDERDFEQGSEPRRFELGEDDKDKTPEIGLVFDDVPGQVSRALKIEGGAYVTSISPGSLADDAGLIGADQNGNGDIIVEANGTKVKNAQDFLDAVRKLDSGEAVVLKFLRIGRSQSAEPDFGTLYTSIVKP